MPEFIVDLEGISYRTLIIVCDGVERARELAGGVEPTEDEEVINDSFYSEDEEVTLIYTSEPPDFIRNVVYNAAP